jgi:hypothetical protein
MSKPEPKKTSPVFWIAIVGVAIAVYFLVGDESSPTGTGKAKQRPKAATQADKDGFLTIDYTAKFAPVVTPAVNAFKPLIARQGSRGAVPTFSNSIPQAFAGGESGWIFTGVATVNGVPNGLIENESTGEGVFLKPGQKWKAAKVITITQVEMVMQGPEGDSRSIQMPREEWMEGGEIAPLPLPLSGPIGTRPVAQNGASENSSSARPNNTQSGNVNAFTRPSVPGFAASEAREAIAAPFGGQGPAQITTSESLEIPIRRRRNRND